MSALDELRQLRHGGVQVRKRDNRAAFWFLAPWFAGLVLFGRTTPEKAAASFIKEVQFEVDAAK